MDVAVTGRSDAVESSLEKNRASLSQLLGHMSAMPQVECPVSHHFSPGVYARETRIPAGTVAVGSIHKFENMLMLILGSATLVGGGEPQEVQAPFIWVSPPGVQRAVYAHTDCVFVSVLGTDSRDVDEIRREFTAESVIAYEQFLLLSAPEAESCPSS